MRDLDVGVAVADLHGAARLSRLDLPRRQVDARFERSDGCQIERWDRNRVLLGDVEG